LFGLKLLIKYYLFFKNNLFLILIFNFFPALTPSVKPLGLISVIAPIGMLDLSSTLALTPRVKEGLNLFLY
jgi:hypothetical protein